MVWRLTGGRVRPPRRRLYSTTAISGRIYQTVNPPRLYMAWAGLGVEVAFLTEDDLAGMHSSILTKRAQTARFSGRTGCAQAGCGGSQARASPYSHHVCVEIGMVLTRLWPIRLLTKGQ